MKIEVYTDASVREGRYAISYQIYSDKYSAICRKFSVADINSNNAEMEAVYESLKHLKYLHRCQGFEIELYTDNRSAVDLVNRGLRSSIYQEIGQRLKSIIGNFKTCTLYHVKAHTKQEDIHSLRNALADKLCRESLTNENSKFYLLHDSNTRYV